jgi:hypothetical protein
MPAIEDSSGIVKPNTEWKVHSHEPIQKLAENLWTVRAPLPGAPLRRVMTIARSHDGELVLHSAVALQESDMREIDQWGTPTVLVVPNGFHRLDAAIFKRRYPALRVIAPDGVRDRVTQVVPVDGGPADFPKWDDIWVEHLAGVRDRELVLSVRSSDGITIVLSDAVFNMAHQKGLGGLILRFLGSSGGPRVSRLFRTVVVRDAPAFREHLERLAATPDLCRVIVAHDETIDKDAASALREAASMV